MRIQAGAVQRYVASNPPDDPKAIAAFLREELAKVQAAMNVIADGQYDDTTVAPLKPRNGMVRYTSGVWNPGAGRGLYLYDNGVWSKL